MASRIVLYSSLLIVAFWVSAVTAASKNGFDLEGSLIPVRKILSGGPPRDGIPALMNPAFITAEMVWRKPIPYESWTGTKLSTIALAINGSP
jgi:hypothetical protein